MAVKRLIIAGRVTGVGFRDWLATRAEAAGVSGWVRNRLDGTVEALIAGETAAVEELVRLCRRGPRMAEVASIEEDFADAPAEPGFRRLPTRKPAAGAPRTHLRSAAARQSHVASCVDAGRSLSASHASIAC